MSSGKPDCANGKDRDVVGSEQAPIDFAHLLEFASGDKKRARRFLGLFVKQSLADLSALASSETPEQWRQAAHSLKSSASAIGAWRLVMLADFSLDIRGQSIEHLRQLHLATLQQCFREVRDEIDRRPEIG